MTKEKKEIFLLFFVILTFLLCISNIIISVKADKFLEAIIVGELEAESGGLFRAFDWKILLIIFSSLLMLSSILGYLFNVDKYKNINKIVQTVLLYINIVLVVLCVFLCVMCILSMYSSLTQLLSIADFDFSYINSELAMVKESVVMINNRVFRDPLIILAVSSVCNLVVPIISLFIKIDNKKEKSFENSDLSNNDMNEDLKKEINKLKQQLELEDLKNQYSDLYKKLHNTEKSDDNSINGTRNY